MHGTFISLFCLELKFNDHCIASYAHQKETEIHNII